MKQCLTNATANIILKNIYSESRPVMSRPPGTKEHLPNLNNIESYSKLVGIVSEMNYCTSRLEHYQKTVQNSFVIPKQDNECKPCCLVLKDIKYLKGMKHLIETNQTVNLRTMYIAENNATFEIPVLATDVHVKMGMQNQIGSLENKMSIPNIFKKDFISRHSRPTTRETHTISGNSDRKQSSQAEPVVKELKTKQKDADCVSSDNIRKGKKNRRRFFNVNDKDEEDDVPLQKIAKKNVEVEIEKHTKNPGVSSVIFCENDSALATPEKYALIVLMHNKKEAFVYRVNTRKHVTDYYVTNELDEYTLACKYPKEEKIIEDYCCWYRREEIIAKICSRKNYPFMIQTFLKLPHNCNFDHCMCCCRIINNNNNSQSKRAERRTAINKSLAEANDWIDTLLYKNNSTTAGIISKAMTYIPKIRNDRPTKKQPEKYLGNYLLCVKNIANRYNGNCYFELYDIGKNGDVNCFLRRENNKQVDEIRKIYNSNPGRETKDAELCCWYKREKLMQELKKFKSSPAALKNIQKAHSCVSKNCVCCCKPQIATLKARQTLPSILKHTNSYEKNVHSLCIDFKAKTKPSLSTLNKNLDNTTRMENNKASTAAEVLSSCPLTDDSPNLSNNELSKFKNIKLGVDIDGKFEAILDSPAKNFSVLELKVLSDIIDIASKQTAELGLSSEELCNRINSKYGSLSSVIIPNQPLIRTGDVLPLQDNNDHFVNDLNDGYIDMEAEDYIPINKIDTRNNSPINKPDADPPKYLSVELPNKITPCPSVKHVKKSVSCMLSLLSNLMAKKNKNYINSFKSFFNKSDISNNKVTALPNQVNSFLDATKIDLEPSLPVIKETFTLVESFTAGVPGPSSISQAKTRAKLKTAAAEISGNSEQILEDGTDTLAENKLHVKPVSELTTLTPNLQESVSQYTETGIPSWHSPNFINQNIQKNASLPPSTTVEHNSQNQSFITKNKVSVGPYFQLVSKPMSNTRLISKDSLLEEKNTTSSKLPARYLTLMPMQKLETVDKNNKTSLLQIRSLSQTPSGASKIGSSVVPKMVFLPNSPARYSVPVSKQAPPVIPHVKKI